MRDLKECKAEVFRRSENRIKARKKLRNRVLSLCIPACLVIGALLILPRLPSQQKNISHSEGRKRRKRKANERKRRFTRALPLYPALFLKKEGQKLFRRTLN